MIGTGRGSQFSLRNLCPVSVVWLSKMPVRSNEIIFSVPSSLPLASLPSLLGRSVHRGDTVSVRCQHTNQKKAARRPDRKPMLQLQWSVNVNRHSKVPVEPADQIFTVVAATGWPICHPYHRVDTASAKSQHMKTNRS